MQPFGAKLVKIVDKGVEAKEQRKKGRTHLGASVLGRKCLRQIWYGWRWVHVVKHSGRLLRLFNRGHREEDRLVEWLRDAGAIVRSHSQRLWYHDGSDSYVCEDWGTDTPGADGGDPLDDVSDDPVHIARATARGQGPKQWGFSEHHGHYGGSGDGLVHNLPDEITRGAKLDGPGLLEVKTHNEKSFIALAGKLDEYRKWVTDPDKRAFPGKGVLSAKIEHYVQMQVYMRKLGVTWALYIAVCKNTDDLYIEIVYAKPEMADQYGDRAGHIIWAKTPPPRITSDPSWFECRFCDFREVCHHGASPQKNCRSCVFAEPVEDGQWRCSHFNSIIPKEFMPQGCGAWESIET